MTRTIGTPTISKRGNYKGTSYWAAYDNRVEATGWTKPEAIGLFNRMKKEKFNVHPSIGKYKQERGDTMAKKNKGKKFMVFVGDRGSKYIGRDVVIKTKSALSARRTVAGGLPWNESIKKIKQIRTRR